MLFDDKRRALRRALAGALLGMAGGGLAAWAAGSLIAGSPSALALAFLNCGFPRGLEGVGIALSFALYALFGAEVGVATLPFAGDGSALVGRTLAHFALTAATVGLWVGLNFGVRETAAFLVPLALVYLLVWLGRWVGWYAEVSAIRERLGLAPGPSLFHWRETLPYVPFAALLCLLLPFVLRLCDAGDVPVLSGLLYPYLLLPVGAFCSALSLGKRQGFCPLYPVACAGFLFCFALLARLVSNVADTDMLPIAFLAALAGGLTGAAVMVALACWLAILAIPALVWRFAPGPVRLNLRATVLWLPWYLLACTLLPALLGGLAGELATVLAGVYLLPFGCLAIGMSLGKRHGLCPLFPVACALCLLIVVGKRTPALCLVPALSALLGNAAGAYPRERGGTG